LKPPQSKRDAEDFALITKMNLDLHLINHLTIAGWTGRNQEAVEKHIRELEAIGVPRPSSTPIFYRVSSSLLTTAERIEASGDASSGEVEPVLVRVKDELWVGVGSDHTDRKAETIGVTLSKQMCAKPVSKTLWRFRDVQDRWDDLEMTSHIGVGSTRRLYQKGTLAGIRRPEELIELSVGAAGMAEGAAMFCGTFAVLGGLTHSDEFEMELRDPKTGETLTARYSVTNLPVRG